MPRKESFRKYEDPQQDPGKSDPLDPRKTGDALANIMRNGVEQERTRREQEVQFRQDLLIVLRGIKDSIEDLTASVRRAR